jgi:hypothetical protein
MKRILTLTTALTLAAPALAHDHDLRYRLIVADAEAAQIHIVDAEDDTTPTRVEVASPARLYLGPDGRHAWAVSRDAGQVQLLDTGVVEEDHGDHSAVILQAPALLPATASGERPVHFNMDAARVAVFWDGTGAATLHEASAAAAGDLAPVMTIETGAPHHGVAVPVGDFTIATVAPEGEGLPDVLAVLGPDGAELSRVDCLNLHGEGKAGAPRCRDHECLPPLSHRRRDGAAGLHLPGHRHAIRHLDRRGRAAPCLHGADRRPDPAARHALPRTPALRAAAPLAPDRGHRRDTARARARPGRRSGGGGLMRGNRGTTSLKLRRRNEDPMRDFDRLPPELRAWVAAAVLPWRPRSVRRAFDKALAETGDRDFALTRLTALQGRLVARDAAAVWGPDHPAVRGEQISK